jgi:hypothetical protein
LADAEQQGTGLRAEQIIEKSIRQATATRYPGFAPVPVGTEIPVSKDCVMGVSAKGNVTQDGIDKLIAYLQLIKSAFPTQHEIDHQRLDDATLDQMARDMDKI